MIARANYRQSVQDLFYRCEKSQIRGKLQIRDNSHVRWTALKERGSDGRHQLGQLAVGRVSLQAESVRDKAEEDSLWQDEKAESLRSRLENEGEVTVLRGSPVDSDVECILDVREAHADSDFAEIGWMRARAYYEVSLECTQVAWEAHVEPICTSILHSQPGTQLFRHCWA